MLPPADGPPPAWYAIVLSWNGREDTLSCLAVHRAGRAGGPACHLRRQRLHRRLVEAVRERFPQVTLIEAGTNLGSAAGTTSACGTRFDRGATWIVLVNNDATVAPDVIDGFEHAIAERPDAGILAGKVYFADRPTRSGLPDSGSARCSATRAGRADTAARTGRAIEGGSHPACRGSVDGRFAQGDRAGGAARRGPLRLCGGRGSRAEGPRGGSRGGVRARSARVAQRVGIDRGRGRHLPTPFTTASATRSSCSSDIGRWASSGALSVAPPFWPHT